MSSVFILLLGWLLGLLSSAVNEWRFEAKRERILIRKARSALAECYRSIEINKTLIEAGIKRSISDVLSNTATEGAQKIPPPPDIGNTLCKIAEDLDDLSSIDDNELPERLRRLDRELGNLVDLYKVVDGLHETPSGQAVSMYEMFFEKFSKSVEDEGRALARNGDCWVRRRVEGLKRGCFSSPMQREQGK